MKKNNNNVPNHLSASFYNFHVCKYPSIYYLRCQKKIKHHKYFDTYEGVKLVHLKCLKAQIALIPLCGWLLVRSSVMVPV